MSKFKEIYNKRRTYNYEIDTSIVGTATAFFVTLLQLYTSTKTIWVWFRGLVTDGYFMVFFSPLILAYWIILGVLYLPVLIILCLLIATSIPWMYIIELPASVMNKDKIHIPFPDDSITIGVIIGSIIVGIIGFIVGGFIRLDNEIATNLFIVNRAIIGGIIGVVFGFLFGGLIGLAASDN